MFGTVETKKEALRRMPFWDDIEKERELVFEEIEERTKAKDDFKKWVVMEDISWSQKFREI